MRQLLSKCWSDSPEESWPTFKEIFDELSSDVTAYFSEKVDQTEIQNFLNWLDESKNNQKNKTSQKEVKQLKLTIDQLQNERKRENEVKSNIEKELDYIKNKIKNLENE